MLTPPLADAGKKMEEWLEDYNKERPHSAIRNEILATFMKPTREVKPCA